MTKPPETHVVSSLAAVKRGGRLLSPARYRHPGDVIRLIVAGFVLAGTLAVTAVTHATYAGASVALGRRQPHAVAQNSGKMTTLFGGSALITLAYIGALAASIEAAGGGPGIVLIGAVYLASSALAAAAPTPGGLGAIETATVAGLTGVGMAAGPAVSAVLLWRLATYWLPIAPGWLSWRVLRRRDYI